MPLPQNLGCRKFVRKILVEKFSSKNAKIATKNPIFAKNGLVKIMNMQSKICSVCRKIATSGPAYFFNTRRRCIITISLYTVIHKKRATLLLSISSPIIDRFSIFFYWHTPQPICHNKIIIIIISHHSVNVFQHYLVKYKCKQKLTIVTEI